MNKTPLAYVGIALACAYGLASADQNLLSNGDFSNTNQISGWTNIGNALWSSDDSNGNASSGSIEFDVPANSNGGGAQSSCFAVVPGATMSMGGETKTVSGSNFLLVRFMCTIYSDATCQNSIQTWTIRGGAPFGMWGAMAALGPGPPDNSGNLPINAQSVLCEADVGVAAGAAASMRFDNLSFNSQAPPTSVKLQSFDVK